MYLTDEDLIKMLKKCRTSLKPDGLIIIKENIHDTMTDIGDYSFDALDNSVIRSKE